MNKKKILLVFGTRPEAIKMVSLVKEFRKYFKNFITKVCVTAQHREMLDQVLELFEIKPEYDFGLMKKGQDLYDITSKVIINMRLVLDEFKPDIVFVHGDTTTSTATALASFYKQIPVAHIEAGLRTNNIYSPWPEEMNRQITSRIATYHFAPTETAKQNLLKENIKKENILVTGNTVVDALHITIDKIKTDLNLEQNIIKKILESGYKIKAPIILITGHRRENFGEGFLNICNAIKEIAKKHTDFDIVYPVHLNPNVKEPINNILSGIKNVYLIEPINYELFVYLMSKAYLILTDSGGIQEEAPSLGKPVLLMRDTTERPEAVEAGTVKLVGTNKKTIISEVSKLINDKNYYISMSQANNPYGDGRACIRIVDFFKSNK